MKAAFKYFFYWLALMIMGVILFALPAYIVATLMSGEAIDPTSLGDDPWFMSILLLGADLVPLFVFWYRKYARFNFKLHDDFGPRFSVSKLYLWAAVGCIGCLMLDVVFGDIIEFPEWDTEGLESLDVMAENPIGLLVICLTGPLVEEVVFRGAILRRLLEKRYQPWLAILISAIFFAVAHGNFTQGLTAIVIGCFMGWVYHRTRNLWPCVFIHALNNTAACALGYTLQNTAYADMDNFPWKVLVTMLIISIIMIALSVKSIGLLTRDRTPLPPPMMEPIVPMPEAASEPTSQDTPSAL